MNSNTAPQQTSQLDYFLSDAQQVHLIGIGGCGMSGIAEVLHGKGFKVSGSDIQINKAAERLQGLGVRVYSGHTAENVLDKHVVVVSSAIDETNPEIMTAREHNIPVVPRAKILAEIMRESTGIAVAGTHGKTTTTSLLASVFLAAEQDPTFVIGGQLAETQSNARLGSGDFCIAEADESDASFLHLNPNLAIVTNIDMDHLWSYGSDFTHLKQTFMDFIHRLPEDGLAVLCDDDEVLQQCFAHIRVPYISYGFADSAHVQITNYQQHGTQSSFTLLLKQQQKELNLVVNLPGKHNALNATATAIVALQAGISDMAILKGLREFNGVGRRFQQRGHIDFGQGKALLIDDYGHHPREIEATIDAVRAAWPERRLVLAFQPHRYSRTKTLFQEFARILAQVDHLILLDVYSAGELPIDDYDGPSLFKAIKAQGTNQYDFLTREQTITDILENVLRKDDVLVMQGAGDIGAMATSLLSKKC